MLREENQDDEGQYIGHDGEEVGVIAGHAQLVYKLITEGSAKTEEH